MQAIEAMGATLHFATVDVADEGQLMTFLADYERAGWPSIRGVIHTAGVVKDELLLRMSRETFQQVLRPKLRGGWLLHNLLKDAPLDFFVLFSSTGSVIASLGQGNYAAANAFLDALAHHRQALGLPALSLNWGPWSVGMVEQLKLEQYYTRRGIELITPTAGMQTLGRVLSQPQAQLVAITANWSQASESASQLPPMFSLLGQEKQETEASTESSKGELLQKLWQMEESARLPFMLAQAREIVGCVLQLEDADISEQEALVHLGMDSMMAIEIKTRVAANFLVEISVLELLQGISVAGLADRLLSLLQFEGGESVAEAAVEAVSETVLEELNELVELVDSTELEAFLHELEQAPEGEKAL